MNFLFSESPKTIKLSYVFDNVKNWRIIGLAKVYQGSGSASATDTITKSGTYKPKVEIQFKEDVKGTAKITIDGNVVLEINNVRTRNRTRKIPCKIKQYSIPDARTACRNGYRKGTQTQYRIKTVATTERCAGNNIERFANTTFGDWTTTKPPGVFPKVQDARRQTNCGSKLRPVGTVTTQTVESRTVYLCVREDGCTETEQYEETYYLSSFTRPLGTFSAKSQATIDFEAQQKKREEERQRILAQELQNRKDLQNVITPKPTGAERSIQPVPVDTDQRSRYRIITPLVYETVRGQRVEKQRYESVQNLTPNAIANLTLRGYEIQYVDQDTPLSTSKPYAKSALTRAQTLVTPQKISPVRKGSRQGVLEFRRAYADREPTEKSVTSQRRIVR